ncbi:hypothetical protein Q9189_006388 [Teloschistes chrysophthalmus]
MRFAVLIKLLVSTACLIVAAIVPSKNLEKPSIVLVPGAWHSPEHYSILRDLLKHNGYETISHRNPSCNSVRPNSESAAKDAAFIRNHVLMPLLTSGKRVVLVLHSYGGLPGAAAAKGLSFVERRAAEQPGGIVGLIFISALIAHEGQSFLSMLPGQVFDEWVIPEVCAWRPAPANGSRLMSVAAVG